MEIEHYILIKTCYYSIFAHVKFKLTKHCTKKRKGKKGKQVVKLRRSTRLLGMNKAETAPQRKGT